MTDRPKFDYAIWVCTKHRTNGAFGECPLCKEEMRVYLEGVEAPPTPRAEVDPQDERHDLQQWERGVYAAFGFDWDVVLRDEALDAIREIVAMIGLPVVGQGVGGHLEPKEVIAMIRQTILDAVRRQKDGVAAGPATAPCDDCGLVQGLGFLITKGDHHGGEKRVCADRWACHLRSPG